MKIKSNINECEYNIADVCRIINPKQQVLYIKHGLFPIDIYPSIDARTGADIIAMVFSKAESQPLYELWKTHDLY